MEGLRVVALGVDGLKAGSKHASVSVAVDEGVRRVAIGEDGGGLEDVPNSSVK